MLEKLNEKELVKGLMAGDELAFSDLLNQYTERVFNLAMRITRNQEDAEEVLQDVFVTIHKKIASFEGKSAFSSWIYRITANTAFMKLRKRRQSPATSLEDITSSQQEACSQERSDTSDVDYISSRHELRAELANAIEKLADEYRVIFVLRDIDGLSNEEVSEMLNLSVPAIKSRLHRSRLMLRKHLQRFYDDYSSSKIVLKTAAAVLVTTRRACKNYDIPTQWNDL